MLGRLKVIITVLASIALAFYSCHEIYQGAKGLFYHNILDYNEFKEAIINKKILSASILDNKAWFLERVPYSTRFSRHYRSIPWEVIVTDKTDFSYFLNEHNISLITEPSFLNIYGSQLSSFAELIFGIILLVGSLITNPLLHNRKI